MRNSSQGSILVGIAALLLVIGGGMLGGYAWKSSSAEGAVVVDPDDVDPEVLSEVEAAAQAALDRSIVVEFDGRQRTLTLRELGLEIDHQAVNRESMRLAGSDTISYANGLPDDGVVPLESNREVTSKALMKLKRELDRAPRNARMDLEARKIHEATPGYGIDVFGSVSAIEMAARQGAEKVALEGVELEPEITVDDLGVKDIDTVLATFTTKFSLRDKSRNDNLKLAASRIDGHVIQPGEVFSFNETVGARSEKEGYKIAHVITAGEMVDGLAGGACQISTTLHGAAFFSGLEIVSSRPHSRPSTYVAMGLDATVVWPHVDLKLRNNFDFPVVIHYRVARGESVVEILGKEKVYDKVIFEREVEKQLDFDTITREDGQLPVGSMAVEQNGFYGYKLKRRRKLVKNGKVVKVDKWDLRYRPVTEYVRLGINPDPNLPPPKQAKGHGPKPPKRKFTRIVQ